MKKWRTMRRHTFLEFLHYIFLQYQERSEEISVGKGQSENKIILGVAAQDPQPAETEEEKINLVSL